MTTRNRKKIEAEAHARHIAASWPLMLGANIAIAAKLRVVHDKGGHWIHIPVTNPHW
jgi:hypothetical protein